MANQKVYISGKITGIEDSAVALFAAAEEKLKAMGYDTVNPMTLPHSHDKSWQAYMKEDIREMCGCDAVFMLLNWEDSKGARIEHDIAATCAMRIMYELEPETIPA